MIRFVDTIVLHCSATPFNQDIGAEEIRRYHVDHRKWSDIGYHYVIRLDGSLEEGRPLYKQGAHVRGHNQTSIGICYIGGLDQKGRAVNTMNIMQRAAIEELVDELVLVFDQITDFCGHCDFPGVKKTCPNFAVSEEFAGIMMILGLR